MAKIAYRIMACLERSRMVQDEVNKLPGCDVKVFYDDRPKEKRKGTSYTQLKCINDVLEHESEYTHICLLQDDILLVNDFDKCVQKMAEKKPDGLWTLFCTRLGTVDYENPYVEIFPANTWGQANLIPIPMLKKIMEFRQEKMPNYTYDDGLYLLYCYENGLPTYTTKVATCQHLCPTKSMIGFNNKKKITYVWDGEDVYDKINWASDVFQRERMTDANHNKKYRESEYAKYGPR